MFYRIICVLPVIVNCIVGIVFVLLISDYCITMWEIYERIFLTSRTVPMACRFHIYSLHCRYLQSSPIRVNWRYLQWDCRYLQINSVNKCENGTCRFHIYSLNCRYLQLNWRYIQLNWRYLQILPIWRYLQLNCRYLQLNCRYLQLNCRHLQLNCRYLQLHRFGDICNSIGDTVYLQIGSIGDIFN